MILVLEKAKEPPIVSQLSILTFVSLIFADSTCSSLIVIVLILDFMSLSRPPSRKTKENV